MEGEAVSQSIISASLSAIELFWLQEHYSIITLAIYTVSAPACDVYQKTHTHTHAPLRTDGHQICNNASLVQYDWFYASRTLVAAVTHSAFVITKVWRCVFLFTWPL